MTLKQFYELIENNDVAAVLANIPVYHVLRRKRRRQDDGALSFAYPLNRKMVKLMVSNGIDVDEEDTEGNTILITAAASNDLPMVKFLLSVGANINHSNRMGETPFSFACAYNLLAMAKFLHARGANINSVHICGGTPSDDGCSPARIIRFLESIGGRKEAMLGK
jgi:ankyrin repeat protein